MWRSLCFVVTQKVYQVLSSRQMGNGCSPPVGGYLSLLLLTTVAAADKTVRKWNIEDGTLEYVYEGHKQV